MLFLARDQRDEPRRHPDWRTDVTASFTHPSSSYQRATSQATKRDNHEQIGESGDEWMGPILAVTRTVQRKRIDIRTLLDHPVSTIHERSSPGTGHRQGSSLHRSSHGRDRAWGLNKGHESPKRDS